MGRSAPVIIDPTNPQTLYVGSEGGGVFKSSDGGDHWLEVNSGLDELTVDGLAMDPSNPAVLYACGPNGVYKTLTGGEVQAASSSISGTSSREIGSRTSQPLPRNTGMYFYPIRMPSEVRNGTQRD
jgi:hypothetical protein